MRRRTLLLLALTVASGSGMGIFSMLADGMYSAIFLLFFPFLSLLMFASIAFDIARPRAMVARTVATKAANTTTPATTLTIQTTAPKVAAASLG